MIFLKVAAASALCRASSPAVALLLNNCSTFSECSILRSGNWTFLPVLPCRPSLGDQVFPYFLPYTNHPHSQLSSSPDPRAFSRSPHAFSLHYVLSLSTLSSSCFLPPGNAKTYNSLLSEHLRHPDKSTNLTSSAFRLLVTIFSFHSSRCNSKSACFSTTFAVNSPRLLLKSESGAVFNQNNPP